METELKFQIPPQFRAALRRAVATASARLTRLQAIYADTPDRRLAGAGLALRLRKEGRQWVQTLKGRGDGIARRLEHEVALPPSRGRPAIDPARHTGSAAGEALHAALAGARDLGEVFRTDIRRTHRCVSRGGATIEIALDTGLLVAGKRRAEVCEIEFELLAGPPAALPALAAGWVRRFGLWWDVRTKAERGQWLAAGAATPPAVKAQPGKLVPESDPGRAFAAMVEACLAHALPNLSEVASGGASPEHLHQARVGLRRLRTVLRDFGRWSGDEEGALALETAWREPFARLGEARDIEAIVASLQPRLVAIGAPPLAGSPHRTPAADPAPIVRSTEVQGLLMHTLALAMAPAAAGTRTLGEEAPTRLRRAWGRTMADVKRFEQAGPEQQHRTRKRMKRLRYGFEFLAPLYPHKAARRMQRAIAVASEALGELNDLHVAGTAYEALRQAETNALLAVGWLSAQREHAVRAAAVSLRRLAATPQPWRRRATGRKSAL